jgi:hypothetical protein
MPIAQHLPRHTFRSARQIPKDLRLPDKVSEQSIRFRKTLSPKYKHLDDRNGDLKKTRLIRPNHLLSLLVPNLSEVGGCKDKKITTMRLRAAMKMARITIKSLAIHLTAVTATKSKIREVRMWESGEKPIPDKYCPDVAAILGIPEAWLHFHKHWNWWEQLSQKLKDHPHNKSERHARDQIRSDFLTALFPSWGIPWAEWLAGKLVAIQEDQGLEGCWIPLILNDHLLPMVLDENNTRGGVSDDKTNRVDSSPKFPPQ